MGEKAKSPAKPLERRDITRTTPKDFRDHAVYVARVIPDKGQGDYREIYLVEFWRKEADTPVFAAADNWAIDTAANLSWFFEWDPDKECWKYGDEDGPVTPGTYWIIGPIRGA